MRNSRKKLAVLLRAKHLMIENSKLTFRMSRVVVRGKFESKLSPTTHFSNELHFAYQMAIWVFLFSILIQTPCMMLSESFAACQH